MRATRHGGHTHWARTLFTVSVPHATGEGVPTGAERVRELIECRLSLGRSDRCPGSYKTQSMVKARPIKPPLSREVLLQLSVSDTTRRSYQSRLAKMRSRGFGLTFEGLSALFLEDDGIKAK